MITAVTATTVTAAARTGIVIEPTSSAAVDHLRLAHRADGVDRAEAQRRDRHQAVVVLDLVLVPERAQDVREQHHAADHRYRRQPGEQPRERSRHLDEIPRAIIAAQMPHEVGRVGHRGVDHATGATERNPPPVASRDPDQAAHHEQHCERHERQASDNRGEADLPVPLHADPHAERHEHERRILLHGEREDRRTRRRSSTDVRAPPRSRTRRTRRETSRGGSSRGSSIPTAGCMRYAAPSEQRQPLAAESGSGVQEDRDRTGSDRRRLAEEQHARRRPDPIERHQQDAG